MLAFVGRFISVLLLMGTWVMALAGPTWLKEDAPSQYVVQEGDTLWDIAGQFLHDPWRWSELFASSDLDNPDLIYPGDVIILQNGQDIPSIRIERRVEVESVLTKDGVTKLIPRIREYRASKAVPTIPMNVIGPFLTQSQILPPGFMVGTPKIGAIDESRLLVSEGSRFYVEGFIPFEGQALGVYRPGETLVNPATGEVVGEEAVFLGAAEVELQGELSSMILRKGVKEIRIGDRILPLEDVYIEPYFLPKLPDNEAQGYILTVLDGIASMGQYQVVSITGGDDMLRSEGDVLDVIQTQHSMPARLTHKERFEKRVSQHPVQYHTYPPIKIGRMIVFKVFERASLALVMHAERPINLHDEVRRP